MLGSRSSPSRRFPKPFFFRKDEARHEATGRADSQKQQQQQQQQQSQVDKESDKQPDKLSSPGPETTIKTAVSLASTTSNQEQREFVSNFITANHILAQHGLLTGCGHISVRNPEDPDTFIMTGHRPPSLVRNQFDIIILPVSCDDRAVLGSANGGAVDDHAGKEDKGDASTPATAHTAATNGGATQTNDAAEEPYSERFIHSEMYRRFPGVQSVVHAASKPVIALAAAGRPLRPVWHAAGFLGESVPVFEPWQHRRAGDKQDLLISSQHMGEALASAFAVEDKSGGGGGGGDGQREAEVVVVSEDGGDGSKAAEPEGQAARQKETVPGKAVVTQRGHGFVSWGPSLEAAVYRAIHTQENAQMQLQAEALARGAGSGAWVRFLDRAEIADSGEMNDAVAAKYWQSWAAEVRASPQFKNELEFAGVSKI